jgi:Zn-dependent peptidase ImmA (M78 family)/transcriptional regulator with XRE-family HTH domain
MPVDALARKLGTKPDRVAAWEAGEARPTFRQAEDLAHALHVPFGYLFLTEPPEEDLPIPDRRTLPEARYGGLTAGFRDFLADLTFNRDWYRERLIELGAAPLPFVGRFEPSAPVTDVARDIRLTLGLDGVELPSGADAVLGALSDLAEAAGIWVVRTGVVAANPHRPLSLTDFRGLAMADPIAPLIAINSVDFPSAKVFTWAHEIAHLWFGASGISDPDPGARTTDGLEARCNAVAAEVLVPGERLVALWRDDVGLVENLDRIGPQFRVSQVVLSRRAFDLGKITWQAHASFYEAERQRWSRSRADAEGGGDYFKTAPVRSGKRFTRTVLTAVMEGDLLFRDASDLLHMSPKNMKKLYGMLIQK